MSSFLIGALLALCPGHDFDDKGQVITNACQEWMNNCMINEAGINEPTQKEFNSCSSKYRAKRRSGETVKASDIED